MLQFLKKQWLVLILLIALAFTSIKGCNQSNTIDVLKQQSQLDKDFADSLRIDVNKRGEIEYSKATLIADNAVLTDFLAEKDKELAELKKEKNAQVGIITKTETIIDTVVLNQPVLSVDTGTRVAVINNPHYTAKVTSTPAETKLNFRTWDKVKYSIGDDYRLITTHSNPYLDVIELNSFYVKPPAQKKKNWKYYVGAIVGGAVVYTIAK